MHSLPCVTWANWQHRHIVTDAQVLWFALHETATHGA